MALTRDDVGECCLKCCFWSRRNDNPHHGYCRRFPPSVPLQDSWRDGWPNVGANDWCGEFKAPAAKQTSSTQNVGCNRTSHKMKFNIYRARDIERNPPRSIEQFTTLEALLAFVSETGHPAIIEPAMPSLEGWRLLIYDDYIE